MAGNGWDIYGTGDSGNFIFNDPYAPMSDTAAAFTFEDPIGAVRSALGAAGYSGSSGSPLTGFFNDRINADTLEPLYTFFGGGDIAGNNVQSWITNLVGDMSGAGGGVDASGLFGQLGSSIAGGGQGIPTAMLEAFAGNNNMIDQRQAAGILMNALGAAAQMASGNSIMQRLLAGSIGAKYEDYRSMMPNNPDMNFLNYLDQSGVFDMLGMAGGSGIAQTAASAIPSGMQAAVETVKNTPIIGGVLDKVF